MDESVRMGHYEVSRGGVLKNEHGLWIGGFMSNLGVCRYFVSAQSGVVIWVRPPYYIQKINFIFVT